MSRDELDYGMQWITERLTQLGLESGFTVELASWSSSGDDFRANRHTLAFHAQGRRHLLTFRDEDIEDIQGDDSVQEQVERHLRSEVRQLASPQAH